jgi:hypothetical protein
MLAATAARDGDGFIHLGHQVAGQAGAFVAEKNRSGAF